MGNVSLERLTYKRKVNLKQVMISAEMQQQFKFLGGQKSYDFCYLRVDAGILPALSSRAVMCLFQYGGRTLCMTTGTGFV